MKSPFPPSLSGRTRRHSERGSVLLTALIFSFIIGIALVSYMKVTSHALNLSNRTFLADAANNLAEAGTEEAVWSFNRLGNSTNPTNIATAWAGWTLGNTVADVYMDRTGDGYSSVPTVEFSGGAAGYAVLATSTTIDPVTAADVVHTFVSGIVITNPGSGYTTAPTITLTGGGASIPAVATARLAATRTFNFPNLGQNATGVVKVWVAGYNGTAAVPIVVTKAIVTPKQGAPIEKIIKIVLSKNGVLPKGVVAKDGINWNGQPLANSYVSSTVVGVPPFSSYAFGTARANTTVASLNGTIDLSNGTVSGNVMTGPGVSVTGGTITGQRIGNFSYDFGAIAPPASSNNLGTSLPAVLPRLPTPVSATPPAPLRPAVAATGEPEQYDPSVALGGGDTPTVIDGKEYYIYTVSDVDIGALKIVPGKNVIIVGTNTQLRAGLQVPASEAKPAVGTLPAELPKVGSLKIFMDGDIRLTGTQSVNKVPSPNTSWAGALEVYTTTTNQLVLNGNGEFLGSIYAPRAELVGNGGGNETMDLSGSFVVGRITSNGHMQFHFDEGLGSTASAKPWILSLWTEMQTAAERNLYASKLNF